VLLVPAFIRRGDRSFDILWLAAKRAVAKSGFNAEDAATKVFGLIFLSIRTESKTVTMYNPYQREFSL
jgi:hypothetical protein